MHPLLTRQLRKVGLAEDEPPTTPEAWEAFVARVSHAYEEADQERYRLERSIAISSDEMIELNENLARERDQLEGIVTSVGDGLCLLDSDGRVRFVNPQACLMFGSTPEEAFGRRLDELVRQEPAGTAFEMVSACVKTREALQSDDVRFITPAGTAIQAALALTPLRGQSSGAVLLLRDVGERKQLEVTLRHAQKLESVGRMAAGVAHEINTPVQFIGDNVHFLHDAFDELLAIVGRSGCVEGDPDVALLREDIPRAIASALDGLSRVAKIVKAMKIFSRQDQTEEQTWTDLHVALESTITVARNETRFVADVVTELGDVPPIMAHANDLNQVFLNLLVNAAHAVGDVVAGTDRRGRITVRTWRDGADVVIAIEDTGAGIPESIRDRVFDPFFTTKEVGKGTGQGLALARTVVVDKHGGSIGFESTVGKGTTFSIRLPIEGRGPASLAPCSGGGRTPASAA